MLRIVRLLRWSSELLRAHSLFFFFNDTATTEIYTLSLHDALPILRDSRPSAWPTVKCPSAPVGFTRTAASDRKSTRLNSSHLVISYAVFCLKKKKHAILLVTTLNVAMPRTTRVPHDPTIVASDDIL